MDSQIASKCSALSVLISLSVVVCFPPVCGGRDGGQHLAASLFSRRGFAGLRTELAQVLVLDPEGGTEVRRIGELSRRVRALGYSSGGSRLAGASEDAVLKIWDVATGMRDTTFALWDVSGAQADARREDAAASGT